MNSGDASTPLSDISEDEIEEEEVPRYTVDGEINRQYERFNAVGRQLRVRLLPPYEGEDSNPMSNFLTGVTDAFEHNSLDCDDSDMVGITISNEVNVQDKAIGISFRRKDQINSDVIWSVFEEVAQSNARFYALDRLVVTVHSVKMPVGNGRDRSIKPMGIPLETMVRLKRSIIEFKAEENCLAHALISIERLTNDPKYKAYMQGTKFRPVVDHLIATTGIDLPNGGGLPDFARFQEHLKEYRIVDYGGLNCEDIMFDGHVESEKGIILPYDDVTKYYHVIGNLTAALSRKYVCKVCNRL
jgi:hypothetical protein